MLTAVDGRIVGKWIRTASDRGLLSCSFDDDGTYTFAIAEDGELATRERGTYRTATRPSETATADDVIALVVRTETGGQCPLIVRFRGGDMLLDGQRWQRVGSSDQLPERSDAEADSRRAICDECAGSGSRHDRDLNNRPMIVGCWSPDTLWIAPCLCPACGGSGSRRLRL